MALELRQSLKLTQQLVMTPQLQQAIKLLQLSRLELQQAVREELEVNPVLEEDVEGEPEERAVAMIQTLDPVGVGARDLRECLMIQAREKGEEFSLPLTILTDHFDLFTRGDIATIARRLKLSREVVRDAFRKLVTLWPKPGRVFSGDDVHYLTPDAYVIQVENQWVVTLNEDGQPRLRLSSYYRDLLSAGDRLGKEDREFLKQKINSALWFIKSIQQRQRTIYKVVESIMKLQRDFLERGPKFMKPLTLRDVAEDISMHESTVSRVTNSKYVCTPHGIFEMKFFFNSGLNRDGGREDIASKSVKEKILEIIRSEGGDNPLSDQDLVRLLRNQGIRIARRTVTKYRQAMGVLPSSKRKKLF